MDWKSIAGSLIQAGAPLIGTALLGPLGGTIGGELGGVVASALGVDNTPEAVGAALANPTSDLQAKLQAATAIAQAKYPALADLGKAQVQAIAQTMQAELKDGAWYQRMWRPFLMFIWGLSWPYQLYVMLGTHVDPSVIYALSAWNAMPASLAGVYAWGRTQEKISGASKAVIPTVASMFAKLGALVGL